MHYIKFFRDDTPIESEPFTSRKTINFSQTLQCCCYNQFNWEPIGYISLILICVNTLGYVAFAYLTSRDDYFGAINIDLVGSYLCFGLSFVMIAIPTIIAPGVLVRSQTSAFLIFVWSMLYQFWLYHGVYSRLPITNETDWIRWVLISFGLLLPHSLGLSCSSFGNVKHFSLGSTISWLSLLIMTNSNIREWRSDSIGPGDNSQNEISQSDVSRTTTDNATYVSWVTNCFFWFGILLLNSHLFEKKPNSMFHGSFSNHRIRWYSSWLVLPVVLALLYGSSLLFLTHPHFPKIATTFPILQTLDVNPIRFLCHDVSFKPKLQQINVKKVVFNFETDKLDRQHNQTWRESITNVPIINKFGNEQQNDDSKSKVNDVEFSITVIEPISTSTQWYNPFTISFIYPFTANASSSNCYCQNVVDLENNFSHGSSIFTMDSLEVDNESRSKDRYEENTNTITTIVGATRSFLTLFKLKITSELLSGPWI